MAPKSPNLYLNKESQPSQAYLGGAWALEGLCRGEAARMPTARGWAGRRWRQRPGRLGNDIGAEEAAWPPGASGQMGRSMAWSPGARGQHVPPALVDTVPSARDPATAPPGGKQSWGRGSRIRAADSACVCGFFFYSSWSKFPNTLRSRENGTVNPWICPPVSTSVHPQPKPILQIPLSGLSHSVMSYSL